MRSPFLVCFMLGLSAAIGVGLARFAYALILPTMQAHFGWSYAEAGGLNAINSAGYLVGALVAAGLVARFGAVMVVIGGAALTALSITATALVEDYWALLMMRFIPGVAGAFAFVAGGVLAARVASSEPSEASRAVGWFYTGPGVGTVAAGLCIPLLFGFELGGWPAAWIVLGALAGLGTILVAWAARRAVRFPAGPVRSSGDGGVSLVPTMVAYTCFAGGYIGYLTFAIAAVAEAGGGPWTAAVWWLVLGGASIASFSVCRRLLAAADGRSFAALLLIGGIATGLPLIWSKPAGFLVSFVLFGGTFLVVVAATTNMVRLARPESEWPRWIGYFTIAFGLGQTGGPLLGGLLADWLGSSDGVLLVSAALFGIGACVALAQKTILVPSAIPREL